MISQVFTNITDFDVLLVLSMMMLIIGFYGIISKKSMIKIIMGLEFMVTAPNILFIAYGYSYGDYIDPQTQTFVILALAADAAVIGLALTFLRNLWKHHKSTDVSKFTTLKWLR